MDKWTDMYIRQLEKEIRSIYTQSQKDIEEKLQAFTAKYKVKEAKYSQMVKDGKITQAEFDNWKKGQVFQGKQWETKKNHIISVLTDANSLATKISNKYRGNVFIENSNYQAYLLEHKAGVNFGFGLYDSSAINRLIRQKGSAVVLPMWKVDEPKDYIWNNRVVSNSIAQGIIQGERLDQIANRMTEGLVAKNRSKMLTFARTGMTQAQNAGRMDRLSEASKMGIKVHKEWMATLDERTRTTHQKLDGQKQPINKPFKVDGYTINYPGDPQAHPAMVYNCRCTLVGDLDSYPAEYERYDNINGKPIKNMTYQEWKDAKSKTTKSVATPVVDTHRSDMVKAILESGTTKQMTDSQKKEFESIVNGMTDEHLELYKEMVRFHDNSNYTDGPGWYDPAKHKVEMTLSANKWEKSVGRTDATGAWKTKFHEELHQIDHVLGKYQGYGWWADITTCEKSVFSDVTPIGTRLGEAIEKDVLGFINESIDTYNFAYGGKVKHVTDLSKPFNAKAKDAVYEYLAFMYPDSSSKARASAFTDALGLATKARIHPYSKGYWGHSESYSKDRGMNGATSETFAELGSHIMRNDTESVDFLSTVMPNTVKEMKSILSELSKFVKNNKIHY